MMHRKNVETVVGAEVKLEPGRSLVSNMIYRLI